MRSTRSTSCKIHFTSNASGVFYGGQVLVGLVALNFPEAEAVKGKLISVYASFSKWTKRCWYRHWCIMTAWLIEEKMLSGIYVKIIGRGYCRWRSGAGTRSTIHVGEEFYLNEKTFFVGGDSGTFFCSVWLSITILISNKSHFIGQSTNELLIFRYISKLLQNSIFSFRWSGSFFWRLQLHI